MWLIAGTVPYADIPVEYGTCVCERGNVFLPSGRDIPVERGVAALVAVANTACAAMGIMPPQVFVAGDIGRGDGSKELYARLVQEAPQMALHGITFHYLFPDVDWHSKVLLAVQQIQPQPVLVADAGFMYVAKMSGYADAYTLFTPDIGEMAFLADEKAPHPFYTRGFLLADPANVAELVRRAYAHGNCAQHLLVKGAEDHIATGDSIVASVATPNVPAMEAVGGTGDMVTALVTVALMCGYAPQDAAILAAQTARHIAQLVAPTPATPISAFIDAVAFVVQQQYTLLQPAGVLNRY